MMSRSRAAGNARACSAAAAMGALLVCAGCQPTVAGQGRERDVQAAYSMRTLEARLAPSTQVLTVRAAAEQALRSRGYTVTESSGSADSARVVAKSSGLGDWDRVVVESWAREGSTAVFVTCEPFGDEATSRTVLDSVLRRLGK